MIKKVRTKGLGELGRTVEEVFADYEELFRRYEGLWIIGGAAREVFINWRRRILSKSFASEPEQPADLDFVMIGEWQDRPWELGDNDVQYSESMEEYMNTRDLAINEIMLRPDWLVYSEDAEMAADHQKFGMPAKNEMVGPRTTMRGLNTTLELDGEVGPEIRDEIRFINSPFQQLVQLFKAFKKGNEDQFVEELGYKESAERVLLKLYGQVQNFNLDETQNKILAYAKWIVEQEDVDREFGEIKERKEMSETYDAPPELQKLIADPARREEALDAAKEYLAHCEQHAQAAERFFRSDTSSSAAIFAQWDLQKLKNRVVDAQKIVAKLSSEGNRGMTLEKIVRDEIRKRLNEAKKMGYGPDSYENSNDDPGDQGPAKGMYENKDSHIPPETVRAAARRGLELRKKHGKGGLTTQEAGKQGIGSGVARASSLASGDAVSTETLRRMVAFFSRHRKNKSGGEDDAGYIAWLLWGGDPGEAWAKRELADSNQPVA